ncbi:calcium-binding protein [Rhizorhabdus argentea]|uniref:calcium-binding protein n=1 Tax=Rhizorhabdus argentea TaxID=1387174 RepID=UPI0030EB2F48
MAYNDGKYANSANVITDMKYLGLSSVRDTAPAYWYQSKAFDAMANAGIKFDFVASGNRNPADVVAAIETFAKAHPGATIAIEGVNEVNNWPVTFGGVTGLAGATAYMTALAKALAGSAALSNIDTYGLTGANIVQDVDYSNFHAYPKNGAQPLRTLMAGIKDQTSAMAGKPTVLTEAGYYTAPTSSNWGGVDQATQAKQTLNLLMDATKLGVSHTYLYQLLDAYADPSGVSVDKNLGLFDLSNNPKLAATAIHNLTTILGDGGATATTFTTQPLNYTVANLPTDGAVLAMQKSDGKTDLVAWSEPDIWDEINHHAIAAAGKDVTFDFGTNHVSVKIFDPLASAAAGSTYADVTSVHVTITDHPMIVEVTDIPDPVAPPPPAPVESVVAPVVQTATTLVAQAVVAPMATTGPATVPVVSSGDPSAELIASLVTSGTSAPAGGSLTSRLSATRPDFLGGEGKDQVYGDAQANTIIGAGANDTLYGGGGNDKLYGGTGNDVIDGGTGQNQIFGGDGNDTIYGGNGGSSLSGNAGADVIIGGSGNDLIIGGTGIDSLTGNGGDDVFRFTSGDSLGATAAELDRVVDWMARYKIDLDISGSAANYVEAKAATFAAAQGQADALFAQGTIKIAAFQVGTDAFLFAETDGSHAGYDVALKLGHGNLANVEYATFI